MQETIQNGRLLTIKEAAALMRVHRNTIRNWVQAGLLDVLQYGHTVRIPEENLRQVRKAG